MIDGRREPQKKGHPGLKIELLLTIEWASFLQENADVARWQQSTFVLFFSVFFYCRNGVVDNLGGTCRPLPMRKRSLLRNGRARELLYYILVVSKDTSQKIGLVFCWKTWWLTIPPFTSFDRHRIDPSSLSSNKKDELNHEASYSGGWSRFFRCFDQCVVEFRLAFSDKKTSFQWSETTTKWRQ